MKSFNEIRYFGSLKLCGIYEVNSDEQHDNDVIMSEGALQV